MTSLRKVQTIWARRIARLLEARGKSSGLILKEAGLDPARVRGRTPFAKQAALFEAAAAHLKDPSFGLHFGAGVESLDLAVLDHVGTGARSLGDGLENILSYLRVSTDGLDAKLALDGPLAFLTVEVVDAQIRHRQQICEFALVLAMSLLRLTAGRRLRPEWVGFRCNRTQDLDSFERFFGCPVNFGRPKALIVLKRTLLDRPPKPVDQRLLRIFKGYCEESRSKRGRQVSLKDEVAYAVASQLHAGATTSPLVARELGLSERTLARRLARQGVSFGQILDDLRRHLAMRFLAEPDARASQISYLLGYSEPSAFNHAFRRWTGVSPSDHLAGQ